MAFLSLVTGVVDSTGERVDLPQTDGTYLPVRLKLGLNLSGTPATNGGQTDITVDAATVSALRTQRPFGSVTASEPSRSCDGRISPAITAPRVAQATRSSRAAFSSGPGNCPDRARASRHWSAVWTCNTSAPCAGGRRVCHN